MSVQSEGFFIDDAKTTLGIVIQTLNEHPDLKQRKEDCYGLSMKLFQVKQDFIGFEICATLSQRWENGFKIVIKFIEESIEDNSWEAYELLQFIASESTLIEFYESVKFSYDPDTRNKMIDDINVIQLFHKGLTTAALYKECIFYDAIHGVILQWLQDYAIHSESVARQQYKDNLIRYKSSSSCTYCDDPVVTPVNQFIRDEPVCIISFMDHTQVKEHNIWYNMWMKFAIQDNDNILPLDV